MKQQIFPPRNRLVYDKGSLVFRTSLVPRILPVWILVFLLWPWMTERFLMQRAESIYPRWYPWAVVGFAALLWLLMQVRLGHFLCVDENGITEKYLFRTKQLSWRQVRDLGFSYAWPGTAKLYFAEERLETNAAGRKLFTGKACAIRLYRNELKYAGVMLQICRQYTRIRPFVCTEEERLVGKLKLK